MAVNVKVAVEAYLRGELDEALVRVIRHPTEPLVILNYTDACHVWNDATRICRGLILNVETAEVVALPFPKFFPLGAVAEVQPENLPDEPFMAFEKVDGTLGILYRDPRGRPHLATRGSFTAPQAVKGTQMLRDLRAISTVSQDLTLLFEIVYPANRVVIDYGNRKELVLLAIFDRETGEERPWVEVEEWARRLGVRTPSVYTFASLQELVVSTAELPADMEGFVIRFTGGLRVKVKGHAYLEQLKTRIINRGAILTAISQGKLAQYLQGVPEELQAIARDRAADIMGQAAAFETTAHDYFTQAPKDGSRKDFALWVQTNVPPLYHGALFQLLDGRLPNWLMLSERG